jgi:hypothetical protein
MAKIHAVIVAILRAHERPVHRTKLVKLIYLVDELCYRLLGHTLTGLEYEWSHHGPNAVGNAIIGEADKLAARHIVHISPGQSAYGGESFLYELENNSLEPDEEQLTAIESYLIDDVVLHYLKTGVTEITKISKQTEPFQEATQYQVLKMKESPEYAQLLRILKDRPKISAELNKAVSTANSSV